MPTENTNGAAPPSPPSTGHARIETSIRPVVTFGILLAVGMAMVLVAIALLYRGMTHHYARQETPGFFAGQQPAPPTPPAPPLQLDPTADLLALRAHEDQVLQSYGWVDRQHAVVHIPIERAMARYLQAQPQAEPGGAP